MERYIGMDVHAASCTLAVISEKGRKLKDFPVETNGSRELILVLMAFRFVQGALVQQALVSFGSMLADIADQHELESGHRQEGIFFALTSFAGKASSGAGSFVAGVTLDVIHWPTGAALAGAAAVPAETIRALGIVYGPVVAAFAVAAMFSYRLYELNRERHREILDALEARRANVAGA